MSHRQAEEADCIARRVRRITITDGEPAVEFEDGSILKLKTKVCEWSHDNPYSGTNVPVETETESDDSMWWTLYPSRDASASRWDLRFPKVVIDPVALPDDQ